MRTRWGTTDKMLLYKLEKLYPSASYLRYVFDGHEYTEQTF